MRNDLSDNSALPVRRSYRKWAFRGALVFAGFQAFAAAELECLGGEARMMYYALDGPFLFLFDYVPDRFFAWMPGYYLEPLVIGTVAYGVTGAAFGLLLRTCLSWRRRRRGLCVSCGYNLFRNESGRCLECGYVVTWREVLAAAPGFTGSR